MAGWSVTGLECGRMECDRAGVWQGWNVAGWSVARWSVAGMKCGRDNMWQEWHVTCGMSCDMWQGGLADTRRSDVPLGSLDHRL